MKKVILKKMTLNNWRGQSTEVIFGKNITDIYGRNKTGKSTLFNAFYWVFTGFDIKGRANYQLFDNRLPLTYENAIPAEVHIVTEIDGNEYKFSRIAIQSWSRKRGESEYTKNISDDYKVFIDDIALSAGEFKKRIEDLFCPIDALKVILNIFYIFSLEWKEQRELFATICGDIQESDFEGCYDVLFEELKRYSIEELESRVKTKSDPLKQILKSLPLTIETLTKNLPDLSQVEEAKKRIEDNSKEIEDIDKRIQDSSMSVQPLIKKANQQLVEINKLELSLQEDEENFNKEQNKEIIEIQDQISAIEESNKIIEKANKDRQLKVDSIKSTIKYNQDLFDYCVRHREELLSKKNAIVEREFEEDTCSYCGNKLPESKLEILRKRFYEQKEKEKSAVITEGKKNNENRDHALAKIKELEEELKEYDIDNTPFFDNSKLKEKLNQLIANRIDFKTTSEYKKKMDVISNLKSELVEVDQPDNSGLLEMKKTLMDKIKEDSETIGLIKEREKQEKKIKEYQEQQRDTANELAKWERISAELKAYKQEYADLVSKKVNVLLNRCQVQMMSQKKDGTWIPSCIITTDNIPSTVYNAAEVVVSGIDIAEAFQKFYNINMPLFIDNAEGITSNSEILTERQIINLYVSNHDDQLRVEIKDYE